MLKTNRISTTFKFLTVIYVAAVVYLCVANFGKMPDIDKFIFGIPTDKIVHFCMFFPFPILCFFSYGSKYKSAIQAIGALLVICSFGCIFAGLTEIIQGSLPYRSEDIRDFAVDCLAICLSTVIVLVLTLSKIKKR